MESFCPRNQFTWTVRSSVQACDSEEDFVKRQARQNVIYSEVRCSSHLLAKAGAIDGTETANPVPIIDAITKGLRPGEEVQYGRKKYEIEPEQFDDLEPFSKTDARQKEDIHLNVDGKEVKVTPAFEIEDEGGSIDVSNNVNLPAVGEHGYQIAKDF